MSGSQHELLVKRLGDSMSPGHQSFAKAHGMLFHFRGESADFENVVTYEAELISLVSEHPSQVLAKGQLRRIILSLDRKNGFQFSHKKSKGDRS